MSRLVAVALAAVLVLAGCGDGSEGTDETAPPAAETEQTQVPDTKVSDNEVPDLCSLFTTEDFQAVTGVTAGEPEAEAGVGAIRGTCTINAETGFPLVLLGAYNESDREATLAMVEAEAVDDLGMEAYWDDTLGLVVPLEGKDWYLQVMATDGGADLDTSVRVAEIVLDRISG
jgi:hypothetical protein